jgi:siroheme synthase
MGVKHLREIVGDLVAAGRSGETPVAVIRWGSYEGQQTVCGTIDSIADAAEQAEMRAPAVIVIGEVVKLRERLQWFESAVKSSLWEELELVGSA